LKLPRFNGGRGAKRARGPFGGFKHTA